MIDVAVAVAVLLFVGIDDIVDLLVVVVVLLIIKLSLSNDPKYNFLSIIKIYPSTQNETNNTITTTANDREELYFLGNNLK
jgi:type IV secretory pathway VirB3-like protein